MIIFAGNEFRIATHFKISSQNKKQKNAQNKKQTEGTQKAASRKTPTPISLLPERDQAHLEKES
jgi:hypothetical protein